MKKILTLFVLLTCFVSAKSLNDLKTISFNVEEKNKTNKSSELRYHIDMELPNKIKKLVTFPEINKGEQYLYVRDKKIVYLPVFDQESEMKITKDENLVVVTLNNILKNYKEDKIFRKNYDKQEKISLSVSENLSVNIISYQVVDDYVLPKNIEILDKKTKIADITVSDISCNPKLTTENFKFTKDKK